MVGLALALAVEEDEAETVLDVLATKDETGVVLDCDASWRRSNPRLFSGATVDSGIFASTESVDADTGDPRLVDTLSSPPSPLNPGSSTGQSPQVDWSASQYTSMSNLRNPTPRRFEKHFRKALCSYWFPEKHA
jgi:DsbC/DsbD-like thiol-disulfide interchange protein